MKFVGKAVTHLGVLLLLVALSAAARAQIWENNIAAVREKHISRITRVDPEDSVVNVYERLPRGGIGRIVIWGKDTSYFIYDSLNREVAGRSGLVRSTTSYAYDSLNRVSRETHTSISLFKSHFRGLVWDTSVYVRSQHFDTLGRLVQDSSSEAIELLDPERGTAHSMSFSQGRPSFETWRRSDQFGRDSDSFSIDPGVLSDTIPASWHRVSLHDPIRHTLVSIETTKDRRGRVVGIEKTIKDSTTGVSIDSLTIRGEVEVWHDTVRADGAYHSSSNGEITARRYMTPDNRRYISETYTRGKLTARHEYLYEYDLR